MTTLPDRPPATTPKPRWQVLQAEGGLRITLDLQHLLDVLRSTPRCAPWRSGRTLRDIARRSGLCTEPDALRQPITHALLESLEQAGLVERRAGHYRLTPRPATRCPACRSTRIVPGPPPDPTCEELAALTHHRCADCLTWAGITSPTHASPDTTATRDDE